MESKQSIETGTKCKCIVHRVSQIADFSRVANSFGTRHSLFLVLQSHEFRNNPFAGVAHYIYTSSTNHYFFFRVI